MAHAPGFLISIDCGLPNGRLRECHSHFANIFSALPEMAPCGVFVVCPGKSVKRQPDRTLLSKCEQPLAIGCGYVDCECIREFEFILTIDINAIDKTLVGVVNNHHTSIERGISATSSLEIVPDRTLS